MTEHGQSAAELQLAAKAFVERMFGNRIWIERATEAERIRRLMTSVHPLTPARPLKRFGAERDGGYLMPDDLEGVVACVSLGVSTEIGFDLDMAERGLEVIMADASIDGPPKANPKFHFTKKFVDVFDSSDTTTMENLLRPYESLLKGDLLLQMDIEGSEYRVVLDMDNHLLRSFRIIIIEAHRLDRVFARFSFDLIEATFQKLLRHHSVVHIHPNNFRGAVRRGAFEVPRVMEFTFYRRDRGLNDTPSTQIFPHPLDADNAGHKSSLVLPMCWR